MATECKVFGYNSAVEFRRNSQIVPRNLAKFAMEKQWPWPYSLYSLSVSLSVWLYLSVCLNVSVVCICLFIRVPYQDVVVGLVSNQLLIQCVCALLLRGTRNTVAAEQGIITDSAATRDATAAAAAAADNCKEDDSNLLTSTPPLPGL